jgi:hypothetical protein
MRSFDAPWPATGIAFNIGERRTMGEIPRAAAIRGTTMRWAWSEGPTL